MAQVGRARICVSISADAFRIPRLFYYLGVLGICLTVLRPVPSLTYSDALFLVALMLAAVESLLRRRVSLGLPPVLCIGIGISVLGGFLSSMSAGNPETSFSLLLRYFYLLGVWFWLGTIVLREPGHVVVATGMWVASACLSGLGALAQFVYGDVVPGTSPMGLRMTGFTGHVNDLGGAASVAFVSAIMLATRYAHGIARFLSWLALAGILCGLMLSVSLSGIAAGILGVFAWRCMRGTLWSNLALGAVVFLAGVALIVVFGEELYLLQRLTSLTEQGANFNTVSSRMDTFSAAFAEIARSPIVGRGLGEPTRTGDVVHNMFLLQWYESGVLGLLGTVLIAGVVLRTGIQLSFRSSRQPTFHLAPALLASFVAFVALGMGQPIYFNRYGWIAAALLLALAAVERRRAVFPGPGSLPVAAPSRAVGEVE